MALRSAAASGIVQYEPYAGEIDRTEMPDGNYLGVVLSGREQTGNDVLFNVFNTITQHAQALSVHGASRQPEMTRDFMALTMKLINLSFTDVHEGKITHANEIFRSTYGGPPPMRYVSPPIRWPEENGEALAVIMDFVSACYQIPHVRCNTLDTGVNTSGARSILAPLYGLKGRLMAKFFQYETRGQISPEELDAIFESDDVRPPMQFSPGLEGDTPEERAAETAAALSDESAPKPTSETLRRAESGVEVWQWVPTKEDWVTFARVLQKRTYESARQLPGAPWPFSVKEISGGNLGRTSTGGTSRSRTTRG